MYLGNEGSIITYNASFEKGRLNESTKVFTSYNEWNQKIQDRIIDLLDPSKRSIIISINKREAHRSNQFCLRL